MTNYPRPTCYPALLGLLAACLTLVGCRDSPPATEPATALASGDAETAAARAALERHLDAVAARDLPALSATLSPGLGMSLILPSAEPQLTVDSFLAFHEAWFEDTAWTWTPRVLDFEAGGGLALATVEATYREPERDGRPYFNRMIITYGLREGDGRWYVVHDHATSAEKSTD